MAVAVADYFLQCLVVGLSPDHIMHCLAGRRRFGIVELVHLQSQQRLRDAKSY
jgi:hypothetical protein